MDYKHSWVVDRGGFYKTIVLLHYVPVYLPPPIGEDGVADYSKVETKMEWVVDSYTLQEGDILVDVPPPHERRHVGDVGIVKLRWDGSAWVEGATAEEITAWEVEHPAPLPTPPAPTEINSMAIAELSIAQAQQNNDTNQAIGELSIMIAGGLNDAV